LYLWEGISVVPVVVGLFGGAEVLQLMMTKHGIAEHRTGERVAGVMQGVRDAVEHWWLVLRASAIGLGIGVIPGMGGAVSQFVAYAHARHTSTHPETFGKGNIEGVIAAGAVNNSREGGNLIPTVAFGIPGSISMAILLSVFLLKGLVPGPAMLTNNLDVTYAMVWIIVLSNIIAIAVSFTFLNQLVRLTYVQATLLVPFLMVLIALGAYTAHNSMADILLMLGATVVGIAAIRWDWPRAPLLLALVLGGIAERYLFLSYSLYEWSWLRRPLVIVFAMIIIGGLVWPLVRGRRGGVGASTRASAGVGTGACTGVGVGVSVDVPPSAPPRADIPITLGFLAAGAWVVFQALDWPFRTSLFPLMTGALLVGLALLKLGASVRRVPRPSARSASSALASPASASSELASAGLAGAVRPEQVEKRSGQPEGHGAPAELVAELPDEPLADLPEVFATASRGEWTAAGSWMAGFFLMLWLLGALVTVPLFAVAYLLTVSRRSPVLAGTYALVSWIFVYGLFDRVLHIPLPAGALLTRLGGM
jgi:hypothetical protein